MGGLELVVEEHSDARSSFPFAGLDKNAMQVCSLLSRDLAR